MTAPRRASALVACVAAALAERALAEPPHLRPEIRFHHAFAADLREELHALEVTVTMPDGRTVTDSMPVTTFRPPGEGPFPLVVYSHGRGPDRGDPSRSRPLQAARYWVRRGFAVLAPTRLGYGATAANFDPEGSPGGCARRRIGPQIRATIAQIHRTLDWAAGLGWADTQRVILHGGSLGGYTSVIALGAGRPGIIAALNFAGGSGGDPKRNPGAPCRPELISEALAAAAARIRQPSLWIYAENDRYWGASHPRAWHAAFTAAGGKAEFHMLPAVSDDGHFVFSRGLPLWRAIADRFLAGLGFPPPRSAGASPATNWAPLDDPARLPLTVSERRTEGYKRFLASDLPRAFAIGSPSAWAFASGGDVITRALANCAKHATDCRLYAVDDAVVWHPTDVP